MYNFSFLLGKHTLYLAPRLINSTKLLCSDLRSVTMNPVASTALISNAVDKFALVDLLWLYFV